MVVVQVGDDDVLDSLRLDPDRFSPHRSDCTIARWRRLRHSLVEAGIDNEGAMRADDRPNKEIERLQHIVRIAADEILRRAARVVPVADRVDIMNVIGHWPYPWLWFLRACAIEYRRSGLL